MQSFLASSDVPQEWKDFFSTFTPEMLEQFSEYAFQWASNPDNGMDFGSEDSTGSGDSGSTTDPSTGGSGSGSTTDPAPSTDPDPSTGGDSVEDLEN